jgi:hypothetical protein
MPVTESARIQTTAIRQHRRRNKKQRRKNQENKEK